MAVCCLGRHCKNDKKFLLLQNAPHLPIDGQLKDILKATPGACLTYVVIEGNQVFTDLYPHLRAQIYKPQLPLCHCVHCRHSATSGGAPYESLPKRNHWSAAEIHIEWTQAGVEQPYSHLVRFQMCI